jgi:transcriptional regulator with XRE-family HTH domain
MKGDLVYEKALHKYFQSSRLYGEWFSPTKKLLKFISSPWEIPLSITNSDKSKTPQDIDIKIGNIIYLARRAKNLSQEQLAHYLGYKSRNSISKIERGLTELKAEDLIELAALLDIDLDELKESIVFEEEAKARVEDSPRLAPHADFILADWSEGEDHWRWVCTASEKEIIDWVEAGSKDEEE